MTAAEAATITVAEIANTNTAAPQSDDLVAELTVGEAWFRRLQSRNRREIEKELAGICKLLSFSENVSRNMFRRITRYMCMREWTR
jgi:glycine cleavage system H lipoate-binding protein